MEKKYKDNGELGVNGFRAKNHYKEVPLYLFARIGGV
jgi:hypothetical protein